MSLSQNKVVVVGGTSGIGNRVAQLALEQGASVRIGGRNPERLNQAVEALRVIRPAVEGHLVDATSEESLRAFFQWTGTFDHLVSMVGGAMGGGFAHTSIQLIRDTVEHKLFDNLRLAQVAAEHFNEGGSLTFTGGTGGRPHTASGAILGNDGVFTMAQGLASELAPRVRVNVVAPTWTETPFWRDMPAEQRAATKKFFSELIPLGRTATIDELASTYIFLMTNSFITGEQIAVDGGVMLRM